MPTPEDRAREAIDAQLEAAGWLVQDRADANLSAGPGVAVREFAMPGAGEADYALFAGGKAVGIVEAKKRGETLTGVEGQAANYSAGFPGHIPAWRRPLPMVYVATDVERTFTNLLDPDPRSRPTFAFHKPDTLREWAATSQALPNGRAVGETSA